MSKEFYTGLSSEHIKRNGSVRCSKALNEIIWNSIDSDSNNIEISIKKESQLDSETITSVEIIDDGHGLPYDDVDAALSIYGKSEKAIKVKSPLGRTYHGRLGEGRYTAFSIGNSLYWESIYQNGDGEHFEYSILFDDNSAKVVVNDQYSTKNKIGLKVSISQLKGSGIEFLSKEEEVKESIIKEFAPYIFSSQGISISLNQNPIDFNSAVEEKRYYTLKLVDSFSVSLVKWKDIRSGDMYLLGSGNVNFYEEKLDYLPTDCSIYITSAYFDKTKEDGKLDLIKMSELWPQIEKFIQQCINDFENEHKIQANKKFIDDLKEVGAYPFSEESDNVVEENTRKVFDVLAVNLNEISPRIRTASKETKRFTFSLMRQAIEEKPSSLNKIIKEVFNLSKEKQDEFAELLDSVSLTSMINTIGQVKDRLLFLEELEEIVNSPTGKRVKERTEFQPLLLSQLWIFGEKYKYGVDDISLRNVLKEHIKKLGLDDIYITDEDRQNTDFNKIPDIVLWSIGEKELSQIKHYRKTVVSDPRFTIKNHRWKFVLVGKTIDDYVQHEISTSVDGVFKDENSVIEVVTWAQIINDNKIKYNFFKEKMEMSLSEKAVSDSLNKRWENLFHKEIK